MKAEERDILLSRLDERSESIIRELKSQSEQIKEFYTLVSNNTVRTNNNRTLISVQWWVISVILLASTLKLVGVY